MHNYYTLEELQAKRDALVEKVEAQAAKIQKLLAEKADFWTVRAARNTLAVRNSDVAMCDAFIILKKREG